MQTYTCRAKLSRQTHGKLDEFLEQQRQLYNGALQERIDCYEKTGRGITAYDQCKSLTEIRADDPEFRQFHAHSQRSALLRLDKAYKRFFKHGGYPRFRGWGRLRSFEAEGVKPSFKDRYGSVKIKGIGSFRWRLDGRFTKEQVKLVRIIKYPKGVYIQLICNVEPQIKGLNQAIGIDVGVKERAILSDGTMIPKHQVDHTEIKQLQRKVARAKRGSNSRKKKVLQLRKAHHRKNIRNRNELHQITTAIIRQHGKWVAVEDLQIKNMTANGGTHKRGLNRSILEQNWGQFIQQLKYKAESAGGELVKVNPKNTTQRCSACGALPQVKLTLANRWYHCTACGHSEDRDINAAKNILLEGLLALISGGNIPEAWVECVRLTAGSRLPSTQNDGVCQAIAILPLKLADTPSMPKI